MSVTKIINRKRKLKTQTVALINLNLAEENDVHIVTIKIITNNIKNPSTMEKSNQSHKKLSTQLPTSKDNNKEITCF